MEFEQTDRKEKRERITNESLISLIMGMFSMGVFVAIIAYWFDEGQGKLALPLLGFVCFMLILNLFAVTASALKISRAIKHYNSGVS